jgi:beta-galactosidase/beta-glucuronidase
MQIKIETDLFYQACDELGLLVIQDMPSLRPLQSRRDANGNSVTILPNDQQQVEFARQLDVMVNQFKSFPSIVTWVS